MHSPSAFELAGGVRGILPGSRAHACRGDCRREEWEQKNGILTPTITTKMRERKQTEEPSQEKVALPPVVEFLGRVRAASTGEYGGSESATSDSDDDSDSGWSDDDTARSPSAPTQSSAPQSAAAGLPRAASLG